MTGEPAYWSDEIEAPVPVGTGQLSLGVGLFSPGTASLRETTSAAFRAAATATQTRFNAILGAETPPPAPPAVDTVALAAVVRAAIDPATTVPAAVTAPVTVPGVLGWPSATALAPLAFTPTFPQALYASVRDTTLDRLVPGLSAVVDESICLLGSNSNVVEAILVGANYEFGREALWRGMPVVRDGTYFQQFWPSAAPDITPIAGNRRLAVRQRARQPRARGRRTVRHRPRCPRRARPPVPQRADLRGAGRCERRRERAHRRPDPGSRGYVHRLARRRLPAGRFPLHGCPGARKRRSERHVRGLPGTSGRFRFGINDPGGSTHSGRRLPAGATSAGRPR